MRRCGGGLDGEGMKGWRVGWLVGSFGVPRLGVVGRWRCECARGRGMLTWGFCGCGIIVLFVLQVVGDYYFKQ
jgi:hypothetical protein